VRLDPARSTRALRLGALTILGAVFAALAVRFARLPAVDFPVFHRAGRLFLAGADLYRGAWEYPYRYAPGVAALFAPLGRLGLPAARAAWAVVSVALAWSAAALLSRRRRSALAGPLAWLCLIQPLAQEIAHGQVDVLVLFLLVAAADLEDRQAEGMAGALVALAAALKVAPVVVALDWIVRRRWRALVGAAAGALLIAIPVLVRYGAAGAVEQHLLWIRTQAADAGAMTATLANQSLWSAAARFGLPRAAAGLGAVALVGMLLASPDRARRRELLVAAVPLVSAYGWPQLFILAVPLVASLIDGPAPQAWLAGLTAAGVSLLSYDVAGPRVEGWAQDHRILGALLLAVIAVGWSASRRRTEAPWPAPGVAAAQGATTRATR
jgi:hypothetical protein